MRYRMPKRHAEFVFIREVSLAEIALIVKRGRKRVQLGEHEVEISLTRLDLFLRQSMCQNCRMPGEGFHLELSTKTGIKTIRYYGVDRTSKKDPCYQLFTLDHIVPRAHGGKTHRHNIQTLCDACNGAKSDMTCKKGMDKFNRRRENPLHLGNSPF